MQEVDKLLFYETMHELLMLSRAEQCIHVVLRCLVSYIFMGAYRRILITDYCFILSSVCNLKSEYVC